MPGTYISPAETGLYYLQSRYYDPEIGRFLNADAYTTTGRGFVGNNMFAYCCNNPVNMIDITGEDPGDLFDTIDEAAIDAAKYIGPDSFENTWEYSVAVYSIQIPYFSVAYKIKTYKFLWFTKTVKKRVVTVKYMTKYTYTTKNTKKDAWVCRIIDAPFPGVRVALVHTHPMGSGEGKTIISKPDKLEAKAHGYIVYVYGPNGELKKYDPRSKTYKDELVTSGLPVSVRTPWCE